MYILILLLYSSTGLVSTIEHPKPVTRSTCFNEGQREKARIHAETGLDVIVRCIPALPKERK